MNRCPSTRDKDTARGDQVAIIDRALHRKTPLLTQSEELVNGEARADCDERGGAKGHEENLDFGNASRHKAHDFLGDLNDQR